MHSDDDCNPCSRAIRAAQAAAPGRTGIDRPVTTRSAARRGEVALGYVRVASSEANRSSAARQVAAIGGAAAAEGLRLAGMFCDEGASGMSTIERSGLDGLTEALRGGAADVLVVEDLARLSRHHGELLAILANLQRIGVQVREVGPPLR